MYDTYIMQKAIYTYYTNKLITFIWKLRLPIKIKVFLWYLYTGVILTKDNLARRQWQGDRKCCFCSSDESIQHLFFDCHFAKFVWRTVHVFFNLIHPTSVQNLFISWLHGINRKLKYKILVGASAICWTIWLTRDDIFLTRLQHHLICRLSSGDLLDQVVIFYYRRRRITK